MVFVSQSRGFLLLMAHSPVLKLEVSHNNAMNNCCLLWTTVVIANAAAVVYVLLLEWQLFNLLHETLGWHHERALRRHQGVKVFGGRPMNFFVYRLYLFLLDRPLRLVQLCTSEAA